MNIEKSVCYKVNGEIFNSQKEAEHYVARMKLQDSVDNNLALAWGVDHHDLIHWMKDNRNLVLEFLLMSPEE